MKAMVFAAGEGTRLRPLTLQTPKALIDVAGRPLLGHVLDSLRRAGVSHVVVNVHHLGDQVKRYLAENDFGFDRVDVSDESDLLLDTGGGLLRARPFLDDGSGEPILLHNADILTDLDLGSIPLRGDATLVTSSRPSSRQLVFDPSGRLTGWVNNSTGETRGRADGTPLSFNGIHLVSPSIFPTLEAYAAANSPVFSLTPFYVANADALEITSRTPQKSYRWHDIGSPAKLAAARADFG